MLGWRPAASPTAPGSRRRSATGFGARWTVMPLGSVATDRLRHMLIGYSRVSKADGSQSLDLLLALKNAVWTAQDGCQTLTNKCREEAQLRERSIEAMKRERALSLNMTLVVPTVAGAFGALMAGVTSKIARWLSSGWATLAAWWNS